MNGRTHVLDNEPTFERLVSFLVDSPRRYHWFGHRFVVMPDHLHLIAHMGCDAMRLGQWVKALKAVMAGLERKVEARAHAASGDAAYNPCGVQPSRHPSEGRVPSHGATSSNEFTRTARAWRWQQGFHDHKFRTPESEHRKWEYVCLNPVRAGLVRRPEEWPFGGEIVYDQASAPRLVRGTPPLLDTRIPIVDAREADGG